MKAVFTEVKYTYTIKTKVDIPSMGYVEYLHIQF